MFVRCRLTCWRTRPGEVFVTAPTTWSWSLWEWPSNTVDAMLDGRFRKP